MLCQAICLNARGCCLTEHLVFRYGDKEVEYISFIHCFVEIESASDGEEGALLEMGRRGWCWAGLAIDSERCVERPGLSHGTDQNLCSAAMKAGRSPRRRPQVEEADQTLGRESAKIYEVASLVEVSEAAVAFGLAMFNVDAAGKEQLDDVAVRRPRYIDRGQADA